MAPETDLKPYVEAVDARLRELLPPVEKPPSDLHGAMRYSCLAPGKRLRPILCMVSAEAVGAPASTVIDAACALEMVHCFSLIHDDLPAIDNDELRRGRPTCHMKFGEGLAILAGDALFALAIQVLAFSPHDPARVVQSQQVLTMATGSDGLVGGEVVDVLSEGKQVDKETLEYIHSRKTGSLISASCAIGAILAGGTAEQVQLLSQYGRHIGLAFQIADDLLNETSTSEQLGKAAGSDRERQKATYPALYGLEAAKKAALDESAAGKACLESFGERAHLLRDLALFAVERLH